jgi:hypothetical protein
MTQQNFLSQNGFRFNVKRLPNISFFVQSVNIPGVTMSADETPTPFNTMYRVGDRLTWDDLTLTIRSDEDLEAFSEIFDWMVAATKANGFAGYEALVDSDDGVYSDATLTILNSKKNSNKILTFRDMFPITLGAINMDVTTSDITYSTFDVTFKYNTYTLGSL